MRNTEEKNHSGVKLKNSRKKLKLIKDFTPCPVCPGDEVFRNGIFQFNITRMLDYIQHDLNDFILEEVLVNDFPSEFSSINESHMESVELAVPVILAEISPGSYNLIDGNHRMEKARRSGVEKLMAYRLTVEQHVQVLIDKKAYESYVEYWNYKLK